MTLAELRKLLTEWLSNIKTWWPETGQKWDHYILSDEHYRDYLFPDRPDDGDYGLRDDVLHVVLFTSDHRYHISARLPRDKQVGMHSKPQEADDGYLGCTASTRKPRAGETWDRGNDLLGGSLTKETFDAIIRKIVGYELVAKVKPSIKGVKPAPANNSPS